PRVIEPAADRWNPESAPEPAFRIEHRRRPGEIDARPAQCLPGERRIIFRIGPLSRELHLYVQALEAALQARAVDLEVPRLREIADAVEVPANALMHEIRGPVRKWAFAEPTVR